MGTHDGGKAYTFYISQGGVPFCQEPRLPARNRQRRIWGGAFLISKSAEPVKRASDEAKRASDEDAVVITLSEREQEIIDSMSGDKDV